MNVGSMRHKITIQKPIIRQSETGEQIVTWKNVRKDISAEVLTGDSAQNISAGADQNAIIARFVFRYFPATIRDMHTYRVRWQGGLFNILSVTTDKTARREWRVKAEDGKKYA